MWCHDEVLQEKKLLPDLSTLSTAMVLLVQLRSVVVYVAHDPK